MEEVGDAGFREEEEEPGLCSDENDESPVRLRRTWNRLSANPAMVFVERRLTVSVGLGVEECTGAVVTLVGVTPRASGGGGDARDEVVIVVV